MRKTKEDTNLTKQTLLDSARKMFLEKGYSATTLSDIVINANLTRGAAYWHFKNKEEIYKAVIIRELDIMQTHKNNILNDCKLTTENKLLEILSLPLELPDTYYLVNSVSLLVSNYEQLIILENMIQERKKSLHQFFYSFLDSGVSHNDIKLTSDVDTVASMLFILFEGLYFHSRENNDFTKDNLRKFLHSIIQFM